LKIHPANRIADFKPYFFAQLNQRLTELKKKGIDIIRLDMGSPDLPPEDFIIESLVKSAWRSDSHGYSPMGGTPTFRQAAAAYYSRRFHTTLDPEKQILALIGSKEGLFTLSQVLLNPGDQVLVPDPGYPVYQSSAVIAGAVVHPMPLLPNNNYLPKFEDIPGNIAKAAKILWLNYPNNPTGASASIDFFRQAVDFARNFDILIAHDAPYVEISYEPVPAPSILEIPGAVDVCVEFNSLSKTYNMAGWRLGIASGNADVLQLIHTYKSQVDSSQFTPILEAGATALNGDQTWLKKRNLVYKERRDIVFQELQRSRLDSHLPSAGLYIWFAIPKKWETSAAFCDALLDATGVSITPGSVYGSHGEGFGRISLVTATPRIFEAMQRMAAWLK
jgi:LL-diaminopimelate aminotransferase